MIYNYIIAGAGLGGLSFVYHSLKSGLSFDSMLVLDRDPKTSNDRTWSFWSDQKPDYECANRQIWNQLGFASDDYIRFDKIAPYHYYTINGIDFYNEVKELIRKDPRITLINTDIQNIQETEKGALVNTDESSYFGEIVIDSVTRPNIKKDNYINISQSFFGLVIETDRAYFNPERPILMDFRVPQIDATCFAYLLPYSDSKALIEYTQFTSNWDFNKSLFRKQLKNYISNVLCIKKFEIVEEEVGQIPMTNFEFDARPSSHVHRLGTAGGDTKPTTGYTFINVQNHVKKILANDIEANPKDNRFEFYDSLLLQIMASNPTQVKQIMEYLFKSQPIERVLKFLDEDTNLLEEMMIFGQLPWTPFFNSLSKKVQYGLSL